MLPSTRIVILGAPRADKAFILFSSSRDKTLDDLEKGRKTIEDVEAEIKRIQAASRANFRLGTRG